MNKWEECNNIVVVRLPESEDRKTHRLFLDVLRSEIAEYRPRVILDCSGRDTVSRAAILLLLSCLEEALKRNGDARLSGVSPVVKAALQECHVDRLFQIFSSKAEAIESFRPSTAVSGIVQIKRGEGDHELEKTA